MIEPIDFLKVNEQLTGRPINEAIVEFAKIITDKVNEVVTDYNERIAHPVMVLDKKAKVTKKGKKNVPKKKV